MTGLRTRQHFVGHRPTLQKVEVRADSRPLLRRIQFFRSKKDSGGIKGSELTIDALRRDCQGPGMPRQLRGEYEGAIYHVLNRGDRREAIFTDKANRERFLETLADRRQCRAGGSEKAKNTSIVISDPFMKQWSDMRSR